MKTLTALLIFSALSHAHADWIIKEIPERSSDPTTRMTLKIKGDKIRVDNEIGTPPRLLSATITDTSNGEILYIFPQDKFYAKHTFSKAKELETKTPASQASATSSPKKMMTFVDTRRKEKVNGCDAEVFTTQSGTMNISYWMTKDLPNGAAFLEQMKKLRANMTQIQMEGAPFYLPEIFPSMAGLPPNTVPVKAEIVGNDGVALLTVVSIKETQLDDSDFVVPAGYAERQITEDKKSP